MFYMNEHKKNNRFGELFRWELWPGSMFSWMMRMDRDMSGLHDPASIPG